jgi:hypothetical protein
MCLGNNISPLVSSGFFYIIGNEQTTVAQSDPGFLLRGFLRSKVAKLYNSSKVLHKVAIGTVFISHKFVKGCEL